MVSNQIVVTIERSSAMSGNDNVDIEDAMPFSASRCCSACVVMKVAAVTDWPKAGTKVKTLRMFLSAPGI